MESFFILSNAPFLWLALGAVLLAFEAFGATGIGFLFAGLGAIVTAVLAHFGLAQDWYSQIAWFFGVTALWAVLLWKPMKKLRAQRHSGKDPYSNMIGDEVTVQPGGLQQGKTGKVKWSGTIMNARLVAGIQEMEEGDTAIIQSVDGTMLMVAAEQKGE